MDNEQKKFCPNCGAQIEDGARFCTSCGGSLASEEVKQEESAQEAQQQQYTAPEQTYNYYQGEATQTNSVSKKNSIISMIFGLIALESSVASVSPIYVFMFFPIAIIFAILGMVKSGQYAREAGASNAFSKVGKITSIISIPVAVIFGIIGLVLTVLALLEL